MKPERTSGNWALLAFILVFALCTAYADGLNNNEVEFTGAISSLLVNGEGVGTLFVRMSDYDLRVVVNARTEISGPDGVPVEMGDLKKEDVITITGKYSASGILASKIRLDDNAAIDFRVRGTIKSLETSTTGSVLTLLGIEVIVTKDTKIGDETAALTSSSLTTGLRVEIEGAITTNGWEAAAIRILSSDKKKEQVKFEGTIISVAGDFIQVEAQGLPLNVTKVMLEAKTRILGDLVKDAAVYVVGTLNPDLSVTAREVRVLQGMEIKPDEKKLKIGESATFILKLRESAAEDIPVTLTIADGTIASLSPSSLTIKKGSMAGEFVVTGGPNTGSTEITASAAGQKATAQIKVGLVSEDENEKRTGPASIVFAPEKIKMGLNESRDVNLLIKPPQKSLLTVDVTSTGGLVKVGAVTRLSNGAAAFKVTIQSADKPGNDTVVATLPTELGGAKTELLVEVAATKPDTSNTPKARIDFSPHEVKLAVGESLDVTLSSSRSYEKDVAIALAVAKGAGTIEVPKTATLGSGTKTVKITVKGLAEGKATLTATMPSELGGDTASLGVQVKNK